MSVAMAKTRSARTLATEWKDFSRCLPPNASVDQYNDMQAAFYGGAAALFYLLTSQLEPGTEATEVDLHMMDSIFRELTDFQALLSALFAAYKAEPKDDSK